MLRRYLAEKIARLTRKKKTRVRELIRGIIQLVLLSIQRHSSANNERYDILQIFSIAYYYLYYKVLFYSVRKELKGQLLKGAR